MNRVRQRGHKSHTSRSKVRVGSGIIAGREAKINDLKIFKFVIKNL